MIHHAPAEDVGLVAQVRLEITRAVRGPRFLLLAVGLPLAIYVAYLVTGIGATGDPPIAGVAWPAYLMVSMAAFGAMNAAVGVAAGRYGEIREATQHGGDHTARTSLVVRSVAAMVLALPPLLLLGSVAIVDGVRLPGIDWLVVAPSLWLGALPFVLLGLCLGPLLDADTGEVVLLSVLVVLAILGGLFQPISTFPAVLEAVARVVPSYHLADLGWTAIAAGTADPIDVLVLAGYTLALGGVVGWRYRSGDAQVGA